MLKYFKYVPVLIFGLIFTGCFGTSIYFDSNPRGAKLYDSNGNKISYCDYTPCSMSFNGKGCHTVTVEARWTSGAEDRQTHYLCEGQDSSVFFQNKSYSNLDNQIGNQVEAIKEQERNQAIKSISSSLNSIGNSMEETANSMNNGHSGSSYNSGASSGCSSDYDCDNGYKCVKEQYKYNGVCMKNVNKYGTSAYSSPNSNSIGAGSSGNCSVNSDCPIGFKCDSQYKVCVK